LGGLGAWEVEGAPPCSSRVRCLQLEGAPRWRSRVRRALGRKGYGIYYIICILCNIRSPWSRVRRLLEGTSPPGGRGYAAHSRVRRLQLEGAPPNSRVRRLLEGTPPPGGRGYAALERLAPCAAGAGALGLRARCAEPQGVVRCGGARGAWRRKSGWAALGGPRRRESQSCPRPPFVLRSSRDRRRLVAIRTTPRATSAQGL
jgi:hypothetical protein